MEGSLRNRPDKKLSVDFQLPCIEIPRLQNAVDYGIFPLGTTCDMSNLIRNFL